MNYEIWKPIAGYESNYAISSFGRVRRLRVYHNQNPDGELRPCPKKGGYLSVLLSQNNVQRRFLVHQLVAAAFIAPVAGKTHINHIDGDPANNRVENLEWTTILENNRHARDVLGRGLGELNSNAKLTVEGVTMILSSDKTSTDIAEELGVSISCVSDVRRGKRWAHAARAQSGAPERKEQT